MNLSDIKKWIGQGLLSSSSALTEDQAKNIFKLFKIPVVDEKRETDEKGVLEACRKTGFPVVLKGIGKTILHKTEKGLVRIGLNSFDEVKTALREMEESAGGDIEAFLVQPVI